MAREKQEYRGYGECPECGGPMGRYREGENLTVDRCKKCRREWMRQDGQGRWWPILRGQDA